MSIVAVATTGIYCRTGCPAPAPKATNTGVVPSAEVARAAGYRACKRCDPDREPPAAERVDADVFLPYKGRRDLGSLLSFLAARAIRGVEATTANALVRTLRLPHGAGIMEARVEGPRLRCRVWVEDARDAADAMERSRRLFDLDRDLRAIEADLGADPDLAALMKGRRGKAVPGTVDGFELAVRAILGQQVTVSGARTLATRLVTRFGAPLAERARDLSGGHVSHVFPSPERLADADVADIGMPGARAESIRSLAAAVAAEEIDLSAAAAPADVRQTLTSIRGVGPWTADYVTMRVQRDADAFLSSDLGVRKAMRGLGIHDERRAIEARAELWRPWRAYAQQYLWASLTAG